MPARIRSGRGPNFRIFRCKRYLTGGWLQTVLQTTAPSRFDTDLTSQIAIIPRLLIIGYVVIRPYTAPSGFYIHC